MISASWILRGGGAVALATMLAAWLPTGCHSSDGSGGGSAEGGAGGGAIVGIGVGGSGAGGTGVGSGAGGRDPGTGGYGPDNDDYQPSPGTCSPSSDGGAQLDVSVTTTTTFPPAWGVTALMVFNPVRSEVYVGGYGDGPGGFLAIIDTALDAVVATIALDRIPSAFFLDSKSDKLYIAEMDSAGTYETLVFDLASRHAGVHVSGKEIASIDDERHLAYLIEYPKHQQEIVEVTLPDFVERRTLPNLTLTNRGCGPLNVDSKTQTLFGMCDLKDGNWDGNYDFHTMDLFDGSHLQDTPFIDSVLHGPVLLPGTSRVVATTRTGEDVYGLLAVDPTAMCSVPLVTGASRVPQFIASAIDRVSTAARVVTFYRGSSPFEASYGLDVHDALLARLGTAPVDNPDDGYCFESAVGSAPPAGADLALYGAWKACSGHGQTTLRRILIK